MLAPALVANVRHLFQTEKIYIYENDSKVMPLSFIIFLSWKGNSGNAGADCFDRADKTKLTRTRDQLRARLPNNNVMIITPATVTQPIDVSI